MGVHDLLKDDVLKQGGGDIVVNGSGVGGELLRAGEAGVYELIIQLIDRLDCLETEGYDRVAILAGDGNHALRAESVAIHDKGLDDLGHGFALFAVEHGLLFRCKLQNTTSLFLIECTRL